MLPVAALLFVGAFILGEGPLKDLALALFVGMISGAYSSIFIATPLLAQLKEPEPEMQRLAQRVRSRRAKTAKTVKAGIAGPAGPVDAPAYPVPAESADDDSTEPVEPDEPVEPEEPVEPIGTGGPGTPPRPKITVSSSQPPIISRPSGSAGGASSVRPTSDGASGRPQPQHKPRSQRKK